MSNSATPERCKAHSEAWPLDERKQMIALKTKSEQKLEMLQSIRRPLTDEESDELRRALHAVYVQQRRRFVECEQ